MRVGNFSVRIEGGEEKTNGHIRIPHNQQFSIRLGNHDSTRRCDAEISIDGEHVDTFRLAPGQSFSVEGPTRGDRGRFTAFGAATEEGLDAGADSVSRRDRGLIVVRFRPEYRLRTPPGVSCAKGVSNVGGWGEEQLSAGPVLRSSNSAGRVRCMSFGESAAITGLTGRTDQEWSQAGHIDHDPSLEVVITLRLVATEVPVEDGVRPLGNKGSCGNGGCRTGRCRPKSNPVPAPVE